jgi:glycosyltransferase involved in cell wall biosynthesis
VYYGVSLPPLATNTQRVEFRRELQLMKDAPLVVHVGRFVPQKNHSGVLNVFQRVVQSVPEARLVLVGAGPLLEKTQSQAEALGIRDAVRWLGVRSDVSRLLALCDVFLFPSLFEGFGLAALEANAAGLPVVGSRVPGLTEAVVDNETARLFEATDNLGMAQSVVDLLGNPVIRSALAAKAREHVETRFSIEASADTLVQMYQDSLGDSSSRWSSGNIRQNSPPEDRHARSGGCEHSV